MKFDNPPVFYVGLELGEMPEIRSGWVLKNAWQAVLVTKVHDANAGHCELVASLNPQLLDMIETTEPQRICTTPNRTSGSALRNAETTARCG